eukprot:CAMPEP_0203670908 /NCGR_PEP_ID=MMETSP0090-20130426/6864_1 /ASSEMBLY_ACC=CAM_ASM_001088 /TAXON_ID=426623 /ORGANISM="Chaetoceros affinis, Strain CCMP159" /LENGTH=146 /DNA_ID=CAMNT_0050535885 /DNA_START=138 /DNA_END=574 /DNA_ORIENTATION=+
MLAQVDRRLSDTTIPPPSCFLKEKSWQSVMGYSEETGGNNNSNDELEQQQQQQQNQQLQNQQRPRQPRSVRRQTSTNTAGSTSTTGGLSRGQYTSYENVPSIAGSASSASGAHHHQPPLQFNNQAFLGLQAPIDQHQQHQHQQMSS